MSHVAAVSLYVTDLDALEAVADRLGFKLMRGQKTWAWYGRAVGESEAAAQGHSAKDFGKGVHALRLKDHGPGDYEIGLVARLDGKPGFELLLDSWGMHGRKLTAAAGAGLGTLKRELAAEVSTRILQRQGYRVSRIIQPDGGIKLRGARA